MYSFLTYLPTYILIYLLTYSLSILHYVHKIHYSDITFVYMYSIMVLGSPFVRYM